MQILKGKPTVVGMYLRRKPLSCGKCLAEPMPFVVEDIGGRCAGVTPYVYPEGTLAVVQSLGYGGYTTFDTELEGEWCGPFVWPMEDVS